MKKFIIFVALFTLASIAHSEYQEQQLKGDELTNIGFNKFFPHLYVFNKDGDIFVAVGGNEGDAAGLLKEFMGNLDDSKITRLGKRPPLPNHADWERKFHELSTHLTRDGFEKLLKQGKMTIVGFVLSPDDFPHCGGCKTMYDDLKTLGEDSRVNTVAVIQRKKAAP